MIRRLRRFFALSQVEQRIFAQTFIWAVVYAFFVRVFSFSRIRRSMQDVVLHRIPAEQPSLTTVSKMIAVANRFTPGACLSKAMASRRVLARWGYDSTIRIGVASPGTFQAHAWLECEGHTIGEPGAIDARWAHLTDL